MTITTSKSQNTAHPTPLISVSRPDWASVATSLLEIIKQAKVLGVAEIANKTNPTIITDDEIKATEERLRNSVNTFTRMYLRTETCNFLAQLGEAERATKSPAPLNT